MSHKVKNLPPASQYSKVDDRITYYYKLHDVLAYSRQKVIHCGKERLTQRERWRNRLPIRILHTGKHCLVHDFEDFFVQGLQVRSNVKHRINYTQLL